MTSQKLNLGNYGITLHTQEEQDEKSPLVKNESVGAVGAKWRGYITTVMPWWRHINPSNIGLDGNFIRICMKSSEYNGTYISLPICNNRLIFGKRTFSSSSFWICQPFPFVTSGFFSLFRQHSTSLTFNLEMAINMN